jgi:hypothetical protein
MVAAGAASTTAAAASPVASASSSAARSAPWGFLYWPLFFIPVGPKVNASLFVDHGTEFYRLHPEGGQGRTIDARLSRLTFGFNVGADF